MDSGIFKSAIQEFLRKYEERDSPRFENNKIGNMILVNKYGKILELERKDFLNSNYENKNKRIPLVRGILVRARIKRHKSLVVLDCHKVT